MGENPQHLLPSLASLQGHQMSFPGIYFIRVLAHNDGSYYYPPLINTRSFSPNQSLSPRSIHPRSERREPDKIDMVTITQAAVNNRRMKVGVD